MGARMSSLPITMFCGLAAKLAKGRGAGRAAAMSTAFHAKCAKKDPFEIQRLWSLLSDREQEEVSTWQKPTDVVVQGRTLYYDFAEREVELGLDEYGFYTDNEAHAVTWGHMDFGWTLKFNDHHVAYVEDIKKSVWTTSDGPDSLQLHAYARAFALKHGCTHYVTGLWLATEGEHRWSTEMIALDSQRAEDLWMRIYHAATNVGEASTGDHCDSCWQRLHCPEYVLPAAVADTWLAPVAEGHMPTGEEAAEMLTRLQRAEKVLERAKENLANWVRQGDLVISDGKKVWKPVAMPGRKALNTAALEKHLGSLEPFMKQGNGYFQMRWGKP